MDLLNINNKSNKNFIFEIFKNNYKDIVGLIPVRIKITVLILTSLIIYAVIDIIINIINLL